MPRFSYLQFTPNSDDMNVPGSSDVTRPSEGWKGRDANDALRATNSALRNLGDAAAKLPLDGDGNPINVNLGRIGTAAFENINTFNMTGGTLGFNVIGSVAFNCIIPLICSPVDVPGNYEAMRQRGFDLCDGRTARDPFPPRQRDVKMPDLSGAHLWMPYNFNQVFSSQFGYVINPATGTVNQAQTEINAKRQISVANHNHGIIPGDPNNGITGGTNISYAQLPRTVINVDIPLGNGTIASDNDARRLEVTYSGGVNNPPTIPSLGPTDQPHQHTIPSGGGFTTPLFDIRPPSVSVLFFIRIWG